MTHPDTISHILDGLRNIEREHDCRVLHACEAGSRAWGFPSPDSDYDVRFVYVHLRDWYLRLDEPRDTLEWFAPGELDYSGWELRKTLRLFCKCNLSLNEHLQSPIIYERDDRFAERLRLLIPAYFNPKKAVFHYRASTAKFIEPLRNGEPVGINTVHGMMNSLRPDVNASRCEACRVPLRQFRTVLSKSLFYILRPLLACRWIIMFQTMPPTEFSRLLDETDVPPDMAEMIGSLLKRKETAVEKEMLDVSKHFADWVLTLDSDAERLAPTLPVSQQPGWEPLNRLFLDMVNEQTCPGL